MSTKNKLEKKIFKSKYRPSKIEGMALLPRIKSEIYDEKTKTIKINNSYIFAGTPGIGKTTLAKIITPKDALIINASLNSSVEDLKETVMDYCRTGSMFGSDSINGYKVVYFDEFDGVSQKYQEALRTFMEDFEDRVIFIATVNNISKLSDAIKSRFTIINFDPINEEEAKFLRDEYLERCLAIKEREELNISEEQIQSLININFPDLRSVYNTLQRVKNTGEYLKEHNTGLNVDFYNLIFTKSSTEKTYDWVMSNYGDNVENLIKLCGRPLCRYIMSENKTYITKVPQLTKLFTDYSTQLTNTPDPLVLAVSFIFEIKNVLGTN